MWEAHTPNVNDTAGEAAIAVAPQFNIGTPSGAQSSNTTLRAASDLRNPTEQERQRMWRIYLRPSRSRVRRRVKIRRFACATRFCTSAQCAKPLQMTRIRLYPSARSGAEMASTETPAARVRAQSCYGLYDVNGQRVRQRVRRHRGGWRDREAPKHPVSRRGIGVRAGTSFRPRGFRRAEHPARARHG